MIPPADTLVRILVVDDDELDRLAVRRCLHQMGLQTETDEASSAAATLELARTVPYDCILLDYYLPGEDSLTLLRDLQATVPDIPVVIFTGRGDEDIAVELMKSGAADYLPKASLTPERLTAALRHAREVTEAATAKRRAEHLLRLANDTASHLVTAASADDLMSGLFERISEVLGADAYLSYTLEPPGNQFMLTSFAGFSADEAGPLSELGRSLATNVDEPSTTAALAAWVDQWEQDIARLTRPLGLRAFACHPLIADGRRLGMLCFASRTKERFADDELEFFRTVSRYATAAWQRLRHIEGMRESEQRKDEFLATLAHELRDPLAPLGNVLELLKRSKPGGAVLEQARDTMERQLGHLVRLVDDLLDMSRITRNRLELRKGLVELQSVLHQAVETARPVAESQGHELTVVLPREPVYLQADPVRLAQVFGNLLLNACKYTEEAGAVSLTADVVDDRVRVRVTDSGIGIPADELTTVFDMFSQGSFAKELVQGGLGIGLTLVKRLVDLHGGSVEAASNGPGQGSEFTVQLPILSDATAHAVGEPPAEAPVPPSRRILIVEDNRDTAASLALLLSMQGNTTHEAYDGLAAVAAAADFRPDLVLLDIGLPKLDGFEVCRRIRAEPWGKDIMIVALSGWGQDNDRRKSRQAGFDHHLVKPVNYHELVDLMTTSDPQRSPGPVGRTPTRPA